MLERIDRLTGDIARLTEVIEQLLTPYEEQLQQAESIPGWGRRSAQGAVAETGVDMSKFPTGGLTTREAEVLRLLAEGLSDAEVADRLILSKKTVGHHVSALLCKLGEPTRSRAVATAQRRGIVTPN